MDNKQLYIVLAFYKFVAVENPHEEVKTHKHFFNDRDITSRIYISEEGINGQMSGSKKDAMAYIDWMHSRELFHDVEFKLHYWHEQVFPRTTVKYRKQLVAIDKDIDIEKTGIHLSPAEWTEMLATEEKILIDTRNDYEWKLGHFEGAELPECSTFREFDEYADNLEETVDKKTPVMMYCTGGIRCELYSALLKDKGFEKVYQLDGGIINYGLKEGTGKWKGKLFVFDDRLAIPICNKEDHEIIGTCHHCQCSIEDYYNCANMDCNALYLSCRECLDKFQGCCHEECKEAPRVRPYHELNPHKPFRKYHCYFGEKGKAESNG